MSDLVMLREFVDANLFIISRSLHDHKPGCGGVLNKVLYGKACPEVQSLTILKNIFDPFRRHFYNKLSMNVAPFANYRLQLCVP